MSISLCSDIFSVDPSFLHSFIYTATRGAQQFPCRLRPRPAFTLSYYSTQEDSYRSKMPHYHHYIVESGCRICGSCIQEGPTNNDKATRYYNSKRKHSVVPGHSFTYDVVFNSDCKWCIQDKKMKPLQFTWSTNIGESNYVSRPGNVDRFNEDLLVVGPFSQDDQQSLVGQVRNDDGSACSNHLGNDASRSSDHQRPTSAATEISTSTEVPLWQESAEPSSSRTSSVSDFSENDLDSVSSEDSYVPDPL